MKQKNFPKINKNCLFMKIYAVGKFFLIDFSFADTGCFLFSRFFLINLFFDQTINFQTFDDFFFFKFVSNGGFLGFKRF